MAISYDKWLSKAERRLFEKISSTGYIKLSHDVTALDGEYTAEDLRKIADAMDNASKSKQFLESK